MKKKIFLTLMALITLATCFTACSKNKEKVTIDIAVAPGSSSWISTYAIREGIITSDLCDLEITLTPNFGSLMMSGQYTMGAMQCAAFALEEETNPGTYKALCTFITGKGSEEEERGVCLLCTKKGSGITKVEDILDKTIGVSDLTGTTTTMFLGLLKKNYGISENQLNLVDKSSTVLLEMLRAGELEVALLDGSNTVAQQAYYDENLEVIWNIDHAFYDAYGVWHSPTLLLVKTDFYNEHKDAVKAAYNMLLESEKYGDSNIDTIGAEFIKAQGIGNVEFLKTIQKYHSRTSYDKIEGKTKDGVMAIIQLAVDRGLLKGMPNEKDLFINI